MHLFKRSTSKHDGQAGTGRTSLFTDLNLRAVNRLLLIVVLVLLGAVAYRLYHLRDSAPPASPPSPASQEVTRYPVQEFSREDAYVAQVAERNIFQLRPFGEPVEPSTQVPSDNQQLKAKLRELKQRLAVVGIAWRGPQMVMLYDQRNNRTYFVRESEAIGETGAEVRNISRGEVTIGIEDEEIIL